MCTCEVGAKHVEKSGFNLSFGGGQLATGCSGVFNLGDAVFQGCGFKGLDVAVSVPESFQ